MSNHLPFLTVIRYLTPDIGHTSIFEMLISNNLGSDIVPIKLTICLAVSIAILVYGLLDFLDKYLEILGHVPLKHSADSNIPVIDIFNSLV